MVGVVRNTSINVFTDSMQDNYGSRAETLKFSKLSLRTNEDKRSTEQFG